MTNPSDAAYIVDPDRTVCLCRDGLVGCSVAVAIDVDGAEHLVLIEDVSVGNERVRYDAACTTVIHEQHGPLPPRWQARALRTTPLRASDESRPPCRVEVTRPGGACGWHRNRHLEARR